MDSSRGNHEPLLYNELYNHTADDTIVVGDEVVPQFHHRRHIMEAAL